MKVRKVKIEIKKLNDALDEAGKVFERLSRGEYVREKQAIYFSNLKEMRKVLTEKRLQLLKTIKDKEPESVYQLAKLVNRDIKNVLEDLSYLQEMDVVEITETKKRKVPHLVCEKISLEITI